jgi:hypothetical protein
MISQWIRRTILALLLGFLVGTSAFPSDLTVFIGGVNPGEVASDGKNISLDGSQIFGFRLNNDIVPLFGMEHTLAFSSDFLFPRGIPSVTEAKGFVLNSNLIITVPVVKSDPYITAGIGLIRQYGSADLPVGTKFAVNYGAGVKFPRLAGPLGLRLDARGYRATGILSGGLNIFEVSAGLLLSFGR